jgi:hypothetical protein
LSDSPELLKPNAGVAESGLHIELSNLKAENEVLRQELAKQKQDYAAQLAISKQFNQQAQDLRLQLEASRGGNVQKEIEAEREGLAQLKKQTKEHAAELHREGRTMEVEKVRWQRELSDAKSELKDAKATILNQGNKIRELERGYSLKPNPAERRLKLEIGELRSQLETERADREEIDAELSELKENSAPAAELSQNLILDAATILSQLRTRRKKSKTDLADLEAILEILES